MAQPLQFQAPNFVQPKEFSGIANSIDSLFDNYYRTKQMQQQSQLTKLQIAGAQNQQAAQSFDFAAQNQGLTPQRANAALALGQSGFQGAAAPGNPVQAQAVNDLQTVQHILALHQQSQQLGAQQAQAGLIEAQGKARESNVKANLLGAPLLPGQAEMGAPSGIGGNVISGTVDQMERGNLAPNSLMDAAGRDPLLRLAMQNEANKRGLNEVGLQNQADKTNAMAKYEGGEAVQGKVRTARSIVSDATVLKDLVGKLGSSDYQLINKYGLAVAAQKGSVAAQEILDQSNLVADRFQGLIGGGSDAKLELGQHLFSAAKTDKQLARGVARMAESLNNYSLSLQGKPMQDANLPDAAAAERGGPKPVNRGPITPHAALINKYGVP